VTSLIRGLAFGPSAPLGEREASFRHTPCSQWSWGGDEMRDAQADVPSAEWLRAQLAFKNSMIHGILQFTPSIAFCYVLHRCESLDIRCRESYWLRFRCRPDPPRNPRGKGAIRLSSPWRFPRRELGLVRGPGGTGFPVHARRPAFFVKLVRGRSSRIRQ